MDPTLVDPLIAPSDAARLANAPTLALALPDERVRSRARRLSLRASLLGLVALCVLPAALVSAALIWTNYWLERERIHGSSVLMSDHLAAELDRELAALTSGLRVLASAPELQRDDFATFHRRASDALASQIVNNYVVTDRAGHQRMNTLRAWGEPLPSDGSPAALQRVFDEGAVVVTDLFIGPVTQRPVIAAGVPVRRDGEVVYSLNIGLSPDRIGDILKRRPMPDGWVAAILDGSGTLVARSREADRFVGQKAVPAVLAQIRSGGPRTVETISKEGIPVVSSIARSRVSDWSVAVGAPRSVLEAQLVQLIGWTCAGLLVALLLGLWVALRLAGRVTQAVRGLNDAALALGRGQPVRLPPLQLVEADAVGAAILQAARILDNARHLAHHDPLTGLSNRLLFDEMLRHHIADMARSGGTLAVLALDLDGFKAVNDQHGHPAGDRLLQAVAGRITHALRASDVAARLGGDEFMVLLAPASAEQARITAQRLLQALSEPYDGVPLPVSASIGVAVAEAGQGVDAAELALRADRALYDAKRQGKSRVVMSA
ncbi:sensor domain-containing diguanylate cyclase [Leptothrix discophora]|uniref:Sensor domain-containing diguanylate cyclase n=1 Tax=Leptothrix discophora TaxID=89 RepID=A0ABT9G7B5_LEPDI|nr:sensor domain-containing diguanylate cyclase [Leptothrix discophora]MDP4302378.1 sensor domain-containing diguanylate cyclase [Leptothrix discophora]